MIGVLLFLMPNFAGARETTKKKQSDQDVTVDLGGGVKIHMVAIPASWFLMGSNDNENYEKPAHEVYVDGFYLGKYEVTQIQWRKVMGYDPPGCKDCDNCRTIPPMRIPVSNLT